MQPVRKFDKQYPYILRHGKKQLADIFRLRFFFAGISDFGNFGDPITRFKICSPNFA